MVDENEVIAGIALWCAAQRRAGFDERTRVVVRADDEAAETVLALGDAAAIADAYITAAESRKPRFESEEEWWAGGGARVYLLGEGNVPQSAFVSFDERNGWSDRTGSGWEIEWSDAAAGYLARKPYDSEQYDGDEEAATDREIGRQADTVLRVWASRTRLIKLAGGRALERNPGLGADRCIRRYVFRWGFLEEAVSAGSELATNLHELGLSDVGILRLAHLQDMATAAAEVALDRLVLDDGLLTRAANKMKVCGGNVDILMKLPGILEDKGGALSFVAPGYIPAGVVSVLGGDSGVGKSTAAHDLALLVGTRPEARPAGMTWLGVPAADIAYGTAVFLSGEDPADWLTARAGALRPDAAAVDIIELALDGGDPVALLESIRSVPDLVLLVVDPARSFLTDGKGGPGNEDKSDDVDPCLAKLAAIAAEKRCAVLVLHHIKKGARPASPRDVIEALRGSGAFKARARSCIGLLRRGDVVSVGVAKHNVPPPAVMRTETVKLRRGDGAPRLLPLEAESMAATDTAPQATDHVERVVAAISAAAAIDLDVRRTGKRGIFESNLPELEGLSRNAARDATRRAISSGVVVVDAGGRLWPRGHSGAVADLAGPEMVNAATRSTLVNNAGIAMS